MIDDQKKYFKLLKDVIDSPIYTASNWNDHGKLVPGKQYILGDHPPPLDHRSVGENEVLIELDASSFAQNYKYAKIIFEYLNSQEIPHYCFWSGNKSIHIHIWLDITIEDEQTIEEYKLASKKGINLFREIRMKFAKEIVVQSGLSEDLIGKIVDIQKLSWGTSRATLIRCCGGANKKADKIEKTTFHGGFKTYFPDYDIPTKKPKDNEFDEVVYPLVIAQFKLEEGFVFGILKNFNEVVKNDRVVNIDYEGKHLNLPCVRKTLEGLESGQRAMGSKIVALACVLDHKTLDEAKIIVGEYANNCPQMPEKFTSEEANKWTKWIYNQQEPYWACGNCVINKVCDDSDCELFKEQHKEELALFDTDDPLGIIKEALDVLVEGEDDLKMQLFMLYLTKEFSPDFCVMLDGPASSGKSHVMKAVASLFGKEREEYFIYSRITQSVLNYAEELADSWRHKIVIIEEMQGATQVVEQLRVLISEGQLSLLSTEEDEDKNKVARERIIKFDTLFVTCNAEDSDIGDQLVTRSWILNTDQSQEQTKKIQNRYLERFGEEEDRTPENIEQIRAALKFLKKPTGKIIFPKEFAVALHKFISSSGVRGRRDVQKLIKLIKAIAYFNQKKRIWLQHKKTKKISILADWEDVELVFKYAGDALNASTQGVGERDLEYYKKICHSYTSVFGNTRTFTLEDVQKWLGVSNSNARKIIANLCNAGFFENDTPGHGVKGNYKKAAYSPSFMDNALCELCELRKCTANLLPNIIKESYSSCDVIKGKSLLKNLTDAVGETKQIVPNDGTQEIEPENPENTECTGIHTAEHAEHESTEAEVAK